MLRLIHRFVEVPGGAVEERLEPDETDGDNAGGAGVVDANADPTGWDDEVAKGLGLHLSRPDNGFAVGSLSPYQSISQSADGQKSERTEKLTQDKKQMVIQRGTLYQRTWFVFT